MSEAIDDLTWAIMELAFVEHQQGTLRVPLDRFGDLPGADVPKGTSRSLLRTLYELHEAGLISLLDMKILSGSKGAFRYAPATSNPGVAITSAGIEWIGNHAQNEDEDSRTIGFEL